MIMNGELVMIWKEVITAYFKVLSQHSHTLREATKDMLSLSNTKLTTVLALHQFARRKI